MPIFEIHIYGGQKGYLCWNTSFKEDNQLGDIDATSVNNITLELVEALKKLRELNPQRTDEMV